VLPNEPLKRVTEENPRRRAAFVCKTGNVLNNNGIFLVTNKDKKKLAC
jgi:hypothetical protein